MTTGDPAALADALLELIDDEAERGAMSAAALRRAEEFSWERLVEDVEEAYAQAVEIHGRVN